MKIRDAALLARYIERTGSTQAQVARFSGVSRQFIAQLVYGTRDGCSPTTARKIEAALDLPRGALFADDDTETADAA